MHRTALLGGLLLAMVAGACADGDEGTGGAGPTSGSGGQSTGPGTGGEGGAGGGEGGQGGAFVCEDSMTPADSSCVLTNALGIFVEEAGDDAADGTRETPVKTLARAINLAQESGKRVYACAQTFSEQLTVGAGVQIYGGLSCDTDWSWVDGKPTEVTAAADVIPVMRLLGGQGKTVLSDLRIVAPDAAIAGNSAIAVIADGAEADLVRCHLEAGNGAHGAAGTPHSGTAAAGPQGDAGNNGACLIGTVLGGMETPNPACPESAGGEGGYSSDASSPGGKNGKDGKPMFMSINAGTGQPEDAELVGGPYCTPGLDGVMGILPPDAAGAGGIGKGELSGAGYSGVAGKNGLPGKAGQGGGGGGGGKGCVTAMGNRGDDSGGAGGAGGCGGLGGIGGSPGGSSMALVMFNATIKLDQSTLTAGNGGNGGQGGSPQAGGVGGLGGAGAIDAFDTFYGCKGGNGGTGATGGNAGGGAGGHSLGVAFVGSPPVDVGSSMLHAASGVGGTDSSGGLAGAGSNGIAAGSEEF